MAVLMSSKCNEISCCMRIAACLDYRSLKALSIVTLPRIIPCLLRCSEKCIKGVLLCLPCLHSPFPCKSKARLEQPTAISLGWKNESRNRH